MYAIRRLARNAATIVVVLSMFSLVLAGCQKRVSDIGGVQTVYYLKSWTYVRAAPDPKAKAVVKAGANTRVVISDTENGWSKVGIDNNRIVGWVESSAVSTSTVKEKTRSYANKPAKKKTVKKASASEKKKEAAPAKAQAPAETADVKDTPLPDPTPTQEETEVPVYVEKPAPAPSSSGTSEAHAATTSGDAQIQEKQATPEAFDPF